MKRKLIGVVLAVALAGAGTFVLAAYVQSAEDRALAGERTVDVLVVDKEVRRGTPVEELRGALRTERIPAKVQAAGSVDSLEGLKGRVAAVDLLPGEQVVTARFVTPQVFAAQNRVAVPDGLQLLTVSLSPERVLGGQIAPGSLVGVLASFTEEIDDGEDTSTRHSTHMILQKVLVTFVQGESATDEPPRDDDTQRPSAPGGNFLVTLAVDGASAERIVFAAEHGSLWLTFQPEDAREDGVRPQTMERIYQ